MIVNQLSHAPALRGLIAIVFGIWVLPNNWCIATDIQAVERRLGGAIESGELTIDQAKVMMDALRRVTSSDEHRPNDRDLERRERIYEEALRDIKAAVDNGRISRERGEDRLILLRKRLFDSRPDNRRDRESRNDDEQQRRDRPEALETRLRHAVEEGKISKRQAEQGLEEIQRRFFNGEANNRNNKERDRVRENKKRIDDLRRSREAHSDPESKIRERIREIEENVESGRMSRDEGERHWIQAQKALQLVGRGERDREHHNDDNHDHDHSHDRDNDEHDHEDGDDQHDHDDDHQDHEDDHRDRD